MTGAETKRIAFTVQYDGEAFFGWQLQRGHTSVQGVLEGVLGKLFDSPARVIGSGRTDRGVHAIGQVAAVDAPARWSAAELRRAMNALLPRSVWVAEAAEVAPRFHPRYDAVAR
ncbi:MAG TPA: tRNA pseudouridine synthase A, partial [Longimicrobiaceae bacterium]|nr:tRNA pseudouridine synthase A [Longimicrobiaceae bacterium]